MKKVLLIGASGGIGNKVAEQLLVQKYQVVGTYFKHPERLKNFENSKHFIKSFLDLSNIETINALNEKIYNIYAVINCAGVVEFETGKIKNDLKIWKNTISVNLTGNFLLAKIFRNKIEKNGRFIMISSTDAGFGGAITTSYAVSKAGVDSLTKSVSLLFQDRFIRVNSIAPGWVVTPMIEQNGDEFLEKVAEINPLKRNAVPIDVANLILFLLSDQSQYINGQIIKLEGGYTNQDPTLLLEEDTQNEK